MAFEERAMPASALLKALLTWMAGRTSVADHQVHDLTPEDVSRGMAEGRYLLVDVRETNEVSVEAYPGGVVVPLSDLDRWTFPIPIAKRWFSPAAPGSGR